MKNINKFILSSLYLIFIIDTIKSEIEPASKNLIFVYNHFRHGARGSSKLDKKGKDFFNETYIGNGELNQIGIRMHFLLGLRNKERYSNLLSNSYDPRELFILSTDVNRTLLSAMAQLMALYKTDEITDDLSLFLSIPPVYDKQHDSKILKEGLKLLGKYSLPGKFNIVPIHGMVEDLNRNGCKKVKNFKKSNAKISNITEYVHNFNESYGIELLTLFNIKDNEYFANMEGIITICDQYVSSMYEGKMKKLKILETVGINLTDFENDCNEGIKLQYRYIENGDSDYIAVRVKMSRIMKDMISFMEIKIKDDINNDTDISKYSFNDYSRPKMFTFSGHESTLSPMEIYLQLAFNITDYFHVKFASSMFFELYKKEGQLKGNLNDYYVEYYFDNQFVHKWDFDVFKENILRVSWDEDKIDDYCYVSIINSNKVIKVLFIISVVIIVIMIFVLVFLFVKRKNSKYLSTILEEQSQIKDMNDFILIKD